MKTLAITGGTGGLGTAVVERLSRDYRCILLTRKPPAEESERANVELIHADLEAEPSVRAAFEEIGEIYALIHLVGGFQAAPLAETPLALWQSMLTTNLTTAYLAAKEAIPHLTRPGRIIAIGSAASLTPTRGIAAYAISKAALNTLILTLAEELRPERITANAILPESLATPAMLQTAADPKTLIPLDRIAATIATLLGEDADGITGTLIPVRP